ncbi:MULTISPECIES: acetolactate synthase small subunit [Breznakia]|uniref:Acetolactate synthase small subunit n=1 Tax=Breznakia blatticola TaxID=1754012 RepID=A0A4R7ZC44_9FIRM|nr:MULTISPECIES: acetolactate synthase small subunit [Breznakia]MDH6367265.1 acetolactate synthase-1/3 small subunit [Breznakia sp. PH1-1]MDH6404444.1 acetolactate synthase-1/3 small subunit [Breznakia sp. PF1-11]MDH6412165.1 acetolactate synthase-1/3 small subunit [Breznakia sp. PFB1-11]MDH6414432.1 acetolactate synthase-1/3 small subunit [Breznakia sp. PFB1-14]MDH6416817.1 acetolactate synthase-1/3 small subunit [Breznakia sp. PFB1-4]
MKKEIISVFVENKANVLTRIVSLFGRRGFNIDSLTVSATNDPSISRITVVFIGNDQSLSQILTQTRKLEVVKDIFTLEKESSLYRELLLMKVSADKKVRSAIKEIVDIYRGKIISLSKDSLIVELTGAPEKLDGFMDLMDCYEIIEVCRTGITGISRGPLSNTDSDD